MSCPRRSIRSLFLSDLHLGARASQPAAILSFLRAHEAERIYLVGDVFDLWNGGKVHWSEIHDAVICELNRQVQNGVQVIFLAGNHDARLREPGVAKLPDGWELREAVRHVTADGRSFLVLHGDQCDRRFLRWHWMTRLGSRADAALRAIDAWLGRNFGRRDASAAKQTMVQRLVGAFNALFVMGGVFERRLTALAEAVGMDGVICGHSHEPDIHLVGEIVFANCGDWVDSCTALAEENDGSLRLVEWAQIVSAEPDRCEPFNLSAVYGEIA